MFDCADTNVIRAHFSQWSDAAVHSERALPGTQSTPAAVDAIRSIPSTNFARYNFCIQVDEASLRSVVYDAPPPPEPDATKTGWVKLINKNWLQIEENPLAQPDWEDLCDYEPIEGVTERDVGWMKVTYWNVMLEYFYEEEGLNGWRSDFCRPPEVA